jgi:hypothetical protein
MARQRLIEFDRALDDVGPERDRARGSVVTPEASTPSMLQSSRDIL